MKENLPIDRKGYYHLPEWVNEARKQGVGNYSDELITKIAEEEKRITEINNTEYARRKAVVEAFKLESKNWFEETWQSTPGKQRAKVLKNLSPELPPRFTMSESMKNERKRHEEESKKKEFDQRREAESKAYLTKCIAYLLENGIKADDPMMLLPIKSAEEMEFERLTAERIEEIKKSGSIDFQGDDNCENCDGWDGESRRCECGNRRVSWAYLGKIGSMYVYGEAW